MKDSCFVAGAAVAIIFLILPYSAGVRDEKAGPLQFFFLSYKMGA
jgi:hypothetical protein